MRQAARIAHALPLVATAAALAAASSGAAHAQGIMFTRDVRGAVMSDYVFRGVERAEETAKVGGELRFNGLHAGAVYLQPWNTDDFASEARVFGGWSPHLEDHGSPFDVELGFTWYATPDDAPGFPDDDRFEPYLKLLIDAPLMPSLAGYYDTELETTTIEGRLTHFFALEGLNGLELGLDGGYVSPDAADEHAYAQGSIDFVHDFLGGMEAYVGLRGAVSSEDRFIGDVTPAGPVYDERAKAWVAAGFSASF